jgi:predicted nucleic acid-binding protein
MIIDANVILRAFFPDESGQAQAHALIHDYVMGAVPIFVPMLLPYEVTNAVLQAVRRARIGEEQAREIVQAFEDLSLPVLPVAPMRMLETARRYNCSGYDAAYLALAEEVGTTLVTGDKRLYSLVSPHFPSVTALHDYRGT